MKHFLLKLLIITSLIGGGNAWAETYTVDFESETTAYSNWIFTNFTSKATNSNVTAHGGSYFGTTGGKETGSLQTKEKIAKPSNITFYVSKQSTNTTSSNWKIQISTNGTSWTDVKTLSATSMTKGNWVEVSQDLSNYSDVYVRIYYSGSTAIRCIDDVTLTDKVSITGITVENLKTNFVEGEKLDLTGMDVIVHYDDNTSKKIDYSFDSGITSEPKDGTVLTSAVSKITISYLSYSVDCSINVGTLPSYIAHFSVNGNIDNNNDCTVKEGTAITFPEDPTSPVVPEGKVFIGWMKGGSEITTPQAEAIPVVDKATEKMGNSDVTYYAVFATENGSTPIYGNKEHSATYTDFSGLGQSGGGTSFETTIDGITYSSTSGYGNSSYVQLYQSSSLTVSSLNVIKNIKIICSTTNNNNYSASKITLKNGEPGTYASGASSTNYGIWTSGATETHSVTLYMSAQARMTSIIVTSYEQTGTASSYSDYCTKVIASESDVVFDFTDAKWGISETKVLDGVEHSYTHQVSGYTVAIRGDETNGFKYQGQEPKYLAMGKQGAYLKLPAFPKAVAKIVVVGGTAAASASTDVKQNIFVGNEAASSETTGCSDVDNTYYIDDVFQKAGNIYTLKVTSDNNTQITKVKIYYNDNYTPIYKVRNGSCEHGSVTANIGKSEENGSVTVTATPDAHYSLSGMYYIKDGDETQYTIEDGSFFMPASHVTVYATFVEEEKYTVTWMANGKQVKSESVYPTVGSVAPEVNGESDYSFVGWLSSALPTETTEAQSPLALTANTYEPTADVTLYALYQRSEIIGQTIVIDKNNVPKDTQNGGKGYAQDTKSISGYNFVFEGVMRNGISDYLQFRKSSTSGEEVVYNTNAFSKAVREVVVTYNNATQTNKDGIVVYAGSIPEPTTKLTNPSINDLVYTFACSGDRYIKIVNEKDNPQYVESIVIRCGEPDVEYFATTLNTTGTLNFVATDGESYYATFSNPRNVVMPAEGISAYLVSVTDGKMVLTDLEDDCYDGEYWNLPSNTGYLLKNTSNASVVYTFVTESLGEVDPSLNMLVPCTITGTFKAESDANYYYKLAYGDNVNKTKLGFWWGAENGSGSFNVKAGGALLVVPQSANASMSRGLSFDEVTNIETGIPEIISQDEASRVIFNAQGIKVQGITNSGLYIVNGKKVVIK